MELNEIPNLKGFYHDGCIAIDKSLSNTEKSCILAEEIGHYVTSSGNILDLSKTENKKQEYKARLWAYDLQIGLSGIIKAYEAGCTSIYEMADYLDATEEFLNETLECYRSKYGEYIEVDNYIVYFEPHL